MWACFALRCVWIDFEDMASGKDLQFSNVNLLSDRVFDRPAVTPHVS